jgi:predicted acylesterase/phospholipase RssA
LVDGVFEGGGALGVAYAGALIALAQQGVWFQRVAGTSAGAITAALVAAGYNAVEIDYLCAPQDAPEPFTRLRPASFHTSIHPIRFLSFLDAPTSARHLPIEARRRTTLWQTVKGSALDRALSAEVRTVPINKVVETVTNSVFSLVPKRMADREAQQRVSERVRHAFRNYPERIPLRELMPTTLERTRTRLADAVVNSLLDHNQTMRLFTNLIGSGGLFRGQVFLETMRQALGSKVFPRSPERPVTFRDLPLDLAVIAANLTTREMLVYSKQTTPDQEVALAVRQSMSVPIVFEPVRLDGSEIVDGGIYESFPFWVFTEHAEGYALNTPEDIHRPKVGFLLNDQQASPPEWGCPPTPASDHHMQLETLLELTGVRSLPSFVDERLTERVLALASAIRSTGSFTRRIALEAVQRTHTMHIVEIPLQGFFWLDFGINNGIASYNAIASRGWMATATALQAMPFAGRSSLQLADPYRPEQPLF